MDAPSIFRTFRHDQSNTEIVLQIDHRRFTEEIAEEINAKKKGCEKRLTQFGSHKEAVLRMIALSIFKENLSTGTQKTDLSQLCGDYGVSLVSASVSGVTDLF